MKQAVFNKQEYKLKLLQENIETIVYTVVCFLVPFLIGHPQLVVGTLVNSALVLGAFNVRKHRLLPIIIAPSVGVFARGVIFGPMTIFLVYMIPFIWISNLIIVYMFKYYRNRKIMGIITGPLAKSGFLFLIALAMFGFGIVPKMFLFAMGVMQLATALSGSVLAIGTQKIKRKLNL